MAKTITGLDFRKVASMPESGLVTGCIYFDDTNHVINIATSPTNYTTYAGVRSAKWDASTNTLTIINHDGQTISIDFDNIATTTQLIAELNKVRKGIGFEDNKNAYESWGPGVAYVTGASTVKTAIENLDKAVQEARENAGVTSFAGKTGAISIKTGNDTTGAINFSIDGSTLDASIVNPNSAAYKTVEYFVGIPSNTSTNDTIKGAKAFTSEVLGTSGDASTAITVYGARQKAEDVKTELLGTSGDVSTLATIYGVQNKAQAVKTELLGTSGDASTLATIYGVQNKAEAVKTELFGNSETDSSTTKTIEGLVKKTDEMKTDATLHLYEADGTPTDKVKADGKTYNLFQGTTQIAAFNIEKDSFVTDGSVVRHDNSGEWGSAGTYIQLAIKTTDTSTSTSSEKIIYIPAESLVDSYTADNEGKNVTVTVNNDTNKISAAVDTSDGVSQLNFTGADVTLATIAGKEIKAKLDTLATVAENTVGGVQLSENGNVLSASLIDNAVTTAKIANGNVTTAKIADDNVTTAKLDLSVRTSLEKANTAIQSVRSIDNKVDNSSYIAISVEASTNGREVTLSSHANVTVQDVSTSADSTAMGLAEASNVKTYVNKYVSEQLCWSEFAIPNV